MNERINYELINITEKQRANEIVSSIFNVISDVEEKSGKEYLSEYDKNNKKFTYLAEYLKNLKLRTIILEFNYRDRQYIEDHSRYYSRSFKHYSRRCIRLHFFSQEFDMNKFEKLLTNTANAEENVSACEGIRTSYLGFMLIKPLPFTIFGKTCLKTYPKDKKHKKYDAIDGKRYYETIRKYGVTLFGIDLEVDSVAYQEQDDQIFVCAATALWVAFQCTSNLFNHTIPTPYEITLQATGRKTAGREGLIAREMANAISERGLQAVSINPVSISHAKAVLYAYLKGKVPVILGAKIVPKKDLPSVSDEHSFHAITVLGYDFIDEYSFRDEKQQLNEKTIAPYRRIKNDTGIRNTLFLKSSLIEKIYAHDDQIGPFTRFDFYDEKQDADLTCLDAKPWDDFNNGYSKQEPAFVLNMMLIPLYHKIRIPYKKILDITDEINNYAFPPNKIKYAWDIHLTTIHQLKKDLQEENENNFILQELYQNIKLEILTTSMPRYIWVVKAYNIQDKKDDFALYFDATDMENSNFLLFYLPDNELAYLGVLNMLLKAVSENSKYKKSEESLISYQTKQIFKHITEETDPKIYRIGDIIEDKLYTTIKETTHPFITEEVQKHKLKREKIQTKKTNDCV
jgi:hypothetical protein